MQTPALKPTIGRVIWFHPDAGFSKTNTPADNGDPLPALITRVWNDTLINIGGFDANGQPFARTSVTLLGDGDQAPAGMYAQWMPFQVQQAKALQQPAAQPEAHVSEGALSFIPALKEGECYAGIVIDPDNSQPTHHLILLPGESESTTWPSALTWAEQAGGALPTRQEQALLYANLKPHFKGAWYWSGEQHAGDEAYAWCQYFVNGDQDYNHKGNELRARAVRRLPI